MAKILTGDHFEKQNFLQNTSLKGQNMENYDYWKTKIPLGQDNILLISTSKIFLSSIEIPLVALFLCELNWFENPTLLFALLFKFV